jgi:hypothetical protein
LKILIWSFELLNELLSFLSFHSLSFSLNGGDAVGGRQYFCHLDVLVIVVVVVISAIIFLIEVDQIDISLSLLGAVVGEVSWLSAVEAGVVVSAPIVHCCFSYLGLKLSASPFSSAVWCSAPIYVHRDQVVVHPFRGIRCVEL